MWINLRMRNTWNILQKLKLKYLQGISYWNTWNTSWKLLKLTSLGYEIKVDLWNNEWCAVHLNLLALGSTPRTIIDHGRAPTIDKEKQMRKSRFQFSSVRYDSAATTINKSVIMTMVELLWTLKTGQSYSWNCSSSHAPCGASEHSRPPAGAREVFVHMALKLISTGFQLLFKMLLINWSTL